MTKLPATIGHYEVQRLLAQGGMGVLALARDPHLDRLVAIKLLKVDDEELRERFLREARIAARLQHPHIVSIFGVGEHDGQPFIAMEYIRGETLADIMRRPEPLPLLTKLRLVESLCDGLASAHRAGVVHRDVKPANLMVDHEGRLKILDFGIARAEQAGLTRVGTVMGTPNYMSPEQVRGDVVDHRSDIFSVGVILYELLVGQLPFRGATQIATLQQIISYDPPPVSALDTRLRGALDAIVMRALAKDADQRYQGLGTMWADIARVARELADKGETPTMVVSPDLRLRDHATIPAAPAAPPAVADGAPDLVTFAQTTPLDELPVLPGATPVPAASSPPSPAAVPRAYPVPLWAIGGGLAVATLAVGVILLGGRSPEPGHAVPVLVGGDVPPPSVAPAVDSPAVVEERELVLPPLEEPADASSLEPPVTTTNPSATESASAPPPDRPVAEEEGANAPQASARPETGGDVRAARAEQVGEREGPAIRSAIYRYKLAYEALDPDAVQQVFPGADVAQLRMRFAQYRAVAFQFTGPTQIVSIDDEGSDASVEVGYQMEISPREGEHQVQPPVQARFHMMKTGEAWVVRDIDIAP